MLPGSRSFKEITIISTTTVFIAPGCRISLYTKSDFVAMKTVVGRKNRAPHGMASQRHYFRFRKQLFEEHLADEVQVIFKMFFTIRGDQLLVIRLIIL